MKKIILFLITATIFINNVNSQITKKNWMIGGTMNFSSAKINSANYAPAYTHSEIQIAPNVGYFVANKFASGIKLGFFRQHDAGLSLSSYFDFNVGPFLRYYFLPADKVVNILAEGSYLYGYGGGNTAIQRSSKNTFSFTAGSVVFFNSSVGLEFLISYSTYKFSGIIGSNNTIKFGVGLQVHLEKDK